MNTKKSARRVIARHLNSGILRALESFPAVYINGPRQAGKTTLACKLISSGDFKAKYVTFDDGFERTAAMRNPSEYVKKSDIPLVIDEVQMVPEVFRPLKSFVDQSRLNSLSGDSSPNGQFLLTGSASLTATPNLARAMVGRMATATLLPLSAGEAIGVEPTFLSRCFAGDFSGLAKPALSLQDAIRQASFPGLLSVSKSMAGEWFRNYARKITLEDPRHIYNLEKAERMPVLLQALAARAGNLVNDADLGREVGLNAVTTRNYRGLLEQTFVTHALRPWYRNIGKRLVKSKKVYFPDTMLLCYLLQSTPLDLEKNQPQRFGHVLENFVFTELMKAIHASLAEISVSFYRTNDGSEIDFILEKAGKLVAVEVKHAESIAEKDLSGIRELRKAIGKDLLRSIVLCNSPRAINYGKDIILLPFGALWQ